MSVRLIYIMGAAFSGSTFFGTTLASHPQIEIAGELGSWIMRDRDPGKGMCACGLPDADCPIWSKVRSNVFGKDPSRWNTYQRDIVRYESLSSLGTLWLLRSSPGFKRYGETTTSLLSNIVNITNRPIIVDTTKHPGRGLAISMTPGVDIYFIHLVRNGMGYISSAIKHNKIKKIPNRDMHTLLRKSSHKWVIANLASEYVMRVGKRPGLQIRYEDFIAHPQATLDQIGNFLDIDLHEVGVNLELGRAISFRHTIRGNQGRLSGETTLRRSPGNSLALPGEAKRIFWDQAGWVAKRYGYVNTPEQTKTD